MEGSPMLQEEVITEEFLENGELQSDAQRLGLNPLPDFQAMYEQMVWEKVEESKQTASPKTYEQVHAELQADHEEEDAAVEDEAIEEPISVTAPPKPRVQYVAQADLDAEVAKLQDLSDKAKAGDTKALDQLRHELDKCSHIWRRLADLQVLVEEQMAAAITSEDLLMLESFRKRASELRQQLLAGSCDLLVQMAVSRAVSCWLFTQFLELRVLQDKHPKDGAKQLAQAERRFQSAVRTLALARKLEKHLATA